jgi:hypothetical protein
MLISLIYRIICIVDITYSKRLTRVDRTKYEMCSQQRSEIEWKFGKDLYLRTHL